MRRERGYWRKQTKGKPKRERKYIYIKIHESTRYAWITTIESAEKQCLKVQACRPKAGISTTCMRRISSLLEV